MTLPCGMVASSGDFLGVTCAVNNEYLNLGSNISMYICHAVSRILRKVEMNDGRIYIYSFSMN